MGKQYFVDSPLYVNGPILKILAQGAKFLHISSLSQFFDCKSHPVWRLIAHATHSLQCVSQSVKLASPMNPHNEKVTEASN